MISARIIADSVNTSGNRLTTFLLKYQRMIHAEFLVHRMLSRNASSSRAIPVKKALASISECMAEPIFWGMNESGMQSSCELPPIRKWLVKKLWRLSGSTMVWSAWAMNKFGAHKQIVNRVTEPWSHITVLASATEWGNFFNLRAHPAAMPEIQELAYKMLTAYEEGKPKLLLPGEWHLPFADQFIHEGMATSDLLKISTARAARLSYLTFDGLWSHEADYALHDRLAASGHFSPFEHPACALHTPSMVGNFCGFRQYRKTLRNENQGDFDAGAIFKRRVST